MSDDAIRSSQARAAIFDRIRKALADAPEAVEIPRNYRARTPDVDVIDLFAERVADYQATVYRTTPDALAGTIATALATRGVRRLAVPNGVPGAWLSAASVDAVGDDPPMTHADLNELDGVITACAVAVAETGTIVLDAGRDQGRRVLSLLPDYHLCVVQAEQIVGDVPEAVERLDPRRPMTWISGPSATSDIELKRIEGVHGPRTLDVVISISGR